jgi:choline dehydrogenase-like flavoprotein
VNTGVAVLGSGPAGVACARALLAAGARVTLFDGGAQADPGSSTRYAPLAEKEPADWDPELVDALRQEFQPNLGTLPLKPVLGSLHPYAQEHPAKPAPQAGIPAWPSLAAGGLSTVWGASILPCRDRDLAEWPFGERELAEHYRAVLRFMPLAGDHDALETILPLYTDKPGQLPPTPQIASLMDDFAKSASRLRRAGIVAGRSRLALQTTANHGPGSPCRRAGVCLHGCPYSSIYRTDLEVARMTTDPRFDYRSGQVIERIEEVADHVMLQFRNTGGALMTAQFERAFVATGVLSSTRLGLMTLGAYDQDVELQDSQYFTAPLLRLPSAPVSTTTSSVTLAQAFLEIDNPAVSANSVHVQIYGYSDLVLRQVAGWLRLSPSTVERHGQSLLGRLMLAQCYLHSNSSDAIRVRLQRDETLHFERPADDARPRAEVHAVARWLLRAFRELRTLVLLPQLRVWESGRGNHLGGTLPMARRPRGLQSDVLGRPAGLERVHFVDGSVLPTIPATTVTFTIMANAHRIGHEAAAA